MLARAAADRGWPAPSLRVEVESGSEAKLEKRDELHKLLRELKPGDAVIVTRVDRWSRDVSWSVKQARDLVKRGIAWHSIGDGVDASTESGDVALGYMALAADHELRRIKARTVGARRRLLAQGRWANAAVPYGYKRGSREERKQLDLEIVPADAAMVRLAYERCVSGKSLDEIQEELQVERPDRGWSRCVLREMLRSRVYVGEVKAPGVGWVKGQHAPIIPVALFERAQEALTSRNKGGRKPSPTSRTTGWLVRSEIAWCGQCGARMRSVYSGPFDYLGCSAKCGVSLVRVDATDAAVSTLALARLRELRAELGGPAPETRAKRTRDFAAERAKVEQRRARAVAMAVDGTITRDELAAQKARLDAELAKIEIAADDDSRENAARDPAARRSALADVRALEGAWKRAPVSVRREVLKRLARRVIVMSGEAPKVEWISASDLAAVHNNP